MFAAFRNLRLDGLYNPETRARAISRACALYSFHFMAKQITDNGCEILVFKKPNVSPVKIRARKYYDPCLFSQNQPYKAMHDVLEDLSGASSLEDFGVREPKYDDVATVSVGGIDITSDFRKNGFDVYEFAMDSADKKGQETINKRRVEKAMQQEKAPADPVQTE